MRILSILTWILVTACFSCMPVKVTTDSAFDFSIDNYKTYAHNKISYDTLHDYPDEIMGIRGEIDRHFEKCGLVRSIDPDLLVNVEVILEAEGRRINPGSAGVEARYMSNSREDMDPAGQSVIYDIGAIMIDLVDVNKNDIVFSGTAVGVYSKKEKKTIERMHEALDKICLAASKK